MRKKEAVKKRKKVRVGDKEFISVVATAKYLKHSVSYVRYYIQKGNLPDGTSIEFIK